MCDEIVLEGIGTTATLSDGALTVRATGTMGKGALGAAERTIPIGDVQAVELRDATALVNGKVAIESSVGRTDIPFRRKQAASARVLYEALLARSGVSLETRVTAALANERLAERLARLDARQQEHREQAAAETAARREAYVARKQEIRDQAAARRAAHQDKQVHAAAEFEAARAALQPQVVKELAEATAAHTPQQMAAQAAELAALLDSATVPDDLDAGDDPLEAAGVDDVMGGEPDTGVQVDVAPVDEAPTGGPSVAERAGRILDEGQAAGAAGDIPLEERQIRLARTMVRNVGSRRNRKDLQAEIDRRVQAGTLRGGARKLGTIYAETGFTRWTRTSMLAPARHGETEIEVWTDRLLTKTAAYPITAQTSAQVYVDGQELITSRPTLTRMALLAPLPGPALVPALALQKKEIKDHRTAEVQIRDVNWALKAALNPDLLSEPRQLAEQVNARASQLARAQGQASSGTDLITQLERLEFLVRKGTISAAEAAAIKATMLR